MGPVSLFDLASRQAQWLAARQAAISGNIANANTTGYRATDVEPFSAVVNKTRLALAATTPGHIGFDDKNPRTIKVRTAESWDVFHDGSSVNLEQEMLKAADVHRNHQLNTSVVKAFHRMVLASTKVSA